MSPPSALDRSRPEFDDHGLMAQIQTGDVDALAELYRRYSVRAYGLARSISNNAHDAEEAVQEAFISIWRTREGYQPRTGSAAPWVLTIVRHRAIDVVRRTSRDRSRHVGDERLGEQRSSDDVVRESEIHDAATSMRILLDGLPTAQRDVITLAFFGELTHTEIAEQLELPIGTVKGRMRLGLKKLAVTSRANAA